MTYYQDDHVLHPDQARDREPHVGRRQVTIRFVKTGHKLADPLTKRIKDHDIMTNVMTSRPIHS